jgi:hypothetical protein
MTGAAAPAVPQRRQQRILGAAHVLHGRRRRTASRASSDSTIASCSACSSCSLAGQFASDAWMRAI